MSPEKLPLFPNYIQLRERSHVPMRVWTWARALSVLAVLAYIVLLFIAPQTGLFVFWRLTVPILPLVFLLVPGFWRNVCPLATVNQIPRAFNITRGRAPPGWFTEYSFVMAVGMLVITVASRKWLFNAHGPATGLMLLTGLGGAFIGGWLFRGKSGWCSSICPLYPLQRLYNQTPVLVVANSHCTPCVGCTKNCYDFNPYVAYLADLYDEDRYYRNYRKFFAAVIPGLIAAYFTVPDPPAIAIPAMYAQFAVYILISGGIFFLLDSFIKVTTNKLTAICAAVALNLFYSYALPPWIDAVGTELGIILPGWLAWAGQSAIFMVTMLWVVRTYRKESLFVRAVQHQQADTHVASGAARVLRRAAQQEEKIEITFTDNDARVLAEPGRTLLEVAEANNQIIESGCRMGMCGADPVLILEGMPNLSPLCDEERETLQRLGCGSGGNVRLACMCRARGPVSVSLNAKIKTARVAFQPNLAAASNSAIRRVVIIGNGIAGVTAAEYVRRYHPTCGIHLVARERHHLYNRMAITRLIYGRSAMNHLYLQPDEWYEERDINCWLNTQATDIDRTARTVALATGEILPYDRLILASGSASFVPYIGGFGLPGTFALREAEEAMQLRAFAQTHRCHAAVIAGGGLLGLEVGYALHKLGLDVTVLERGEWLLRRQLDERGGFFLQQYLERLGLDVILRGDIGSLQGEGHVSKAVLKDGRTFPCDLFVVAAGIVPNIELARAAGIKVDRGIVVDAAMRTSDPEIFAAGDVCEFNRSLPGLWPVAVEQARVAAINAMGGRAVYKETVQPTALKIVGVDLISMGRIEPDSECDTVILFEDNSEHRYRKLIVTNNRIVGGIFLGYPQEASAVAAAIRQGVDVGHFLDSLQKGHWEVLREVVA